MEMEYRVVSLSHRGKFILFTHRERAEQFTRDLAEMPVSFYEKEPRKMQEREFGAYGDDSTWRDVSVSPL